MRVLAIDPGYDRLGVAVMERHQNAETVLFSTCITTNKQATLPERLDQLGSKLRDILQSYKPSVVAIETLFFNKNTKTAIAVAQARGVVLFLATQSGATVEEYSPQAIKVAITGYGKSDKQAVTDMVKRLVKAAPKDAHDDEYDAIAIGVTALAHAQSSVVLK